MEISRNDKNTYSTAGRQRLSSLNRDSRWLLVWIAGMAALWTWNVLFLNHPALVLLRTASLNTLWTAGVTVLFSLLLGWSFGVWLHFLEQSRRWLYFPVTFALNLIRSVPQIVGLLIGYVLLTVLIQGEIVRNEAFQLTLMAFVIALFVFLEVADLIRERIAYYKRLDFYDAMLCCGVKEGRIVNIEVLQKNSRAHILHKLISIFGAAVFLQCSIDFIISVGLSTDVSLSNFPVTLGGLLAKLDSKQDILAIGTVFTNPGNVPTLFFEHLQGISVAFTIVFTLLCVYQIANGFVRRHRL